MYYFLALVTAAISSIMGVVNGELKNFYDLYSATVLIHLIGLIPISAVVLHKRVRVSDKTGVPWHHFLGGAVGVVTVLATAAPYGYISVSAIVALSLLGQTASSLLVEQFGLFSLARKPFDRNKLVGLVFAAAGIAVMVAGSAFSPLPVFLAFLSGVSNVVSRCINAQLAEKKGTTYSTWYNYVVGLAVSALVMFLMLPGGKAEFPGSLSPAIWIYFGGLLGNITVVLSMILTVKVPAFILTLILFSGQIFTGIVLDTLLVGAFLPQNLIGGILAAIGLSLNVLLDDRKAKRTFPNVIS